MLRLTLLGTVCIVLGTSVALDSPLRTPLFAIGSSIYAGLAIAHYRRHRRTRHLLPKWLAWFRRI